MCVYAWYDLRPMVLWLRPLRQPKNSAPRSSVVADIGLLTCCRCTASRVACSYPHVPGRGEIPTSISRVDHATGLDQHHLAFRGGAGFVLYAFWHDEHFAGLEIDPAIPEVNRHFAIKHDEDFVGIGVTVPHKFALDLDKLELVVVHLCNHLRRPVVGELAKLGFDIDRCVHRRMAHRYR